MEKQVTSGLKHTFLVHGIMMTIFALVYLFFPILWGDLTGCLSNKVPQVFRMFGTAILGFAVSSFLAFREDEWGKVKIVLQMECIINLLYVVILLLALLLWNLPSIGWMYFGVMSIFALAFNYFYLKG